MNLKESLRLYAKGLAMGAADVVPGVSGGTIAFITGIYDELLSSLAKIHPRLLKDLFTKGKGIPYVWQEINGNFLAVLFAGIATSFISLARVITYFLQHYPILVWSFFFGLIVASIIYIAKQIKEWKVSTFLFIALGIALMLFISTLPPISPEATLLFMFVAGAIGICAMILPGISGGFILLIMGAYMPLMNAYGSFDLLTIAVFGLGNIIGLVLFSNFLKALLKNYYNSTIAVLTGFLIGSMYKVWPWKNTQEVFIKGEGVKSMNEISPNYQSLSALGETLSKEEFKQLKPYVENNILPTIYESTNLATSSQLGMSLIYMLAGFLLIFVIDFLGKSQVKTN